MSKFLVIQNGELLDTVFHNSYTALEVKDLLIDRDGYSNDIHVLEDSEITKELRDLHNNDIHVIFNIEWYYNLAIETGFMSSDTLETFEEFLD